MSLEILKEIISREKKTGEEMESLFNQLETSKDPGEKNMLFSQIKALEASLQQTNQNVLNTLQTIIVSQPLIGGQLGIPITPIIPATKKISVKKGLTKDSNKFSHIEKETLKRLKKKKEIIKDKKERKPSAYANAANRMFGNYSQNLIQQGKFKFVQESIIQAKLRFIPQSYLAIAFFTTFLSVFVGLFLFLFFLAFNLGAAIPIITFMEEGLGIRLLKTFWILFAVPGITFLFMHVYPYLEAKAAESRINQELPFATIHMSAISGAMVDPSKIFSIIVSTKEYPYLEKEFKRLINEVEIYGYNLVTALKNVSKNSPSRKLSELLTGLATTIMSGGDLPNFFQKRADTLMFDYRLEREEAAKSAETFMDIYISVVIAAPMILMLLLIMMKISGLGIGFSTSTITLMTVLGVFMVNVVFLTFLHLKQTG